METKIYLVKQYMRWHDDETSTRDMRKRARAIFATDTREEAAQDVRRFVKEEKQEANDLYTKYWFIEEIELFKALSNH